jgi:hypothetical protein
MVTSLDRFYHLCQCLFLARKQQIYSNLDNYYQRWCTLFQWPRCSVVHTSVYHLLLGQSRNIQLARKFPESPSGARLNMGTTCTFFPQHNADRQQSCVYLHKRWNTCAGGSSIRPSTVSGLDGEYGCRGDIISWRIRTVLLPFGSRVRHDCVVDRSCN